LDGQLFTRADLLEFIGYHDFGIHFAGRAEPKFKAIQRFRNVLTFTVQEDENLRVTNAGFDSERPKDALLDLVQAHTFSTAYYLVEAPDVGRLIEVIRREIADS
jgi:hypothetical protein